jgi:hypothetical protein
MVLPLPGGDTRHQREPLIGQLEHLPDPSVRIQELAPVFNGGSGHGPRDRAGHAPEAQREALPTH